MAGTEAGATGDVYSCAFFVCVLWCGKIYDLTKLAVFPTLQPKPVERKQRTKPAAKNNNNNTVLTCKNT